MEKIFSDTSSVRQYHLHQNVISKLQVGDKVDLFLREKDNGFEDVFVNTRFGEAGQLYSENGNELRKYFAEKHYVISAHIKKILDKEDDMKALIVGYDVYMTDTPASEITEQPQVATTPQPVAAAAPVKKESGCLKAFLGLALALFLIIIVVAVVNSSKDDTVASDATAKYVDSVTTERKEVNAAAKKEDSIKAAKLKGLFTEKKDEFEGFTWVQPKSRPVYSNTNGFYCYFAKEKDGSVSNFRFRGQYAADDWLFINTVKFNIDGKSYDYIPNKVEHDNDTSIWEWYDDQVNSSNIGIIEAIASAKSVKVRFNGTTYYKDKTMSAANIKSIKNTLEYYRALGGKF